ncbi:hypothetical protein ACFRCW_16060 [Streptomyces sp. NPDC056653]|uniref:hypothetical protein n=1 Tax=Streptomyces sp. NPDC056653 TaxID=3345894 RepID=UPI00369BD410
MGRPVTSSLAPDRLGTPVAQTLRLSPVASVPPHGGAATLGRVQYGASSRVLAPKLTDRIVYGAAQNYLTPLSGFTDMRNAMALAAKSLKVSGGDLADSTPSATSSSPPTASSGGRTAACSAPRTSCPRR